MADPDTPASENPFDQFFQHGLGTEPAGLPPAQSEAEANPFDEFFKPSAAPTQPETSTAEAVGLHAGLGAAPMAGGIIGGARGAGIGGAIGAALFGAARGAGVGAAAGAAIPGLGEIGIGELGGGFVGGLIGGFGGAWATGKAQDYAIKQLPDTWRDPLEREIATTEKEHPMASFLGGMIPMVVTMTPFPKGLPANATTMERIRAYPVTRALLGGAIQGGAELGQEALSGEPLDWRKAAWATGFGLVFNTPNALGTRIESIGARARSEPIAPVRARETPPPPELDLGESHPAEGHDDFGNYYEALFPNGKPIESTRPPAEDGGILGLETHTLNGAWGSRVAGPGVTQEVFSGSHEMDPQTKMIAEDRERNETAVYKPPPAPDVGVVARTMNPELFDEHAEALARRDTLQRHANELGDGPGSETAKARLAEADRQVDQTGEQVAAAHRAAAEATGNIPVREEGVRVPPVAAGDALPLDEQRQFIQSDLERRLIAAGRPADEAEATAHVVAERMVTRSLIMEGRLGSPTDIYLNRHAEIRGPDGRDIPPGRPPGAPPPPVPPARPAGEAPSRGDQPPRPTPPAPEPAPARELEPVGGETRPSERVKGPAELEYERIKAENAAKPAPPIHPASDRTGEVIPVENLPERLARIKAEKEAGVPLRPEPTPAREPTPELAAALSGPEPAPAPPSVATAAGEAAAEPTPIAAPAKEPHEAFIDAVHQKLLAGERPFRTIVEARALAKELGFEVGEGESANKAVDELVERAVVATARSIVETDLAAGRTPQETFADMVKLYENQPNLSTRTSTSVAEQAYSTPAPLAYVASRLAGINHETYVLEPTAGNGMLLMEASPAKARVNELNKARADALKAQGFKPSRADGADHSTFADSTGEMDAVIANPPFGAVREGGKSKGWDIDGFKTTQIDHAIALNALKTMKAEGRAVLIIGGVKAENEHERAKGYTSAAKRRFFHELLKNYKVSDVFTVDGDLYAKQGAGWPVDVITIEGRGQSERDPLTKSPPPLLKSWDEVGARLDAIPQRDETAPGPVEPDRGQGGGVAEGERQPAPGNAVGGGEAVGGEPAGQPGPAILGEPAANVGGAGVGDGEPGHPLGEHPLDEGAGNRPEQGGDVRATDLGPYSPRERPVAAEANEGQTAYEPASREGVKLNTLLPANLRDATNASLDRLEREHGNIDSYVADSLGRDPKELGKYFSAEQVDAIGLGISNIDKGEGFIIGDQTGLGKGRVVAAMITYARRRGLMPVFVTEKPDLYGDMWRDLHDIGWDQQLGRPIDMMMTNSSTRVPLDDEALESIAERDEAKAEGRPLPEARGSFSAAQSSAKARERMNGVLNASLKNIKPASEKELLDQGFRILSPEAKYEASWGLKSDKQLGKWGVQAPNRTLISLADSKEDALRGASLWQNSNDNEKATVDLTGGKSATLPDVVFTTYDQMNSVKGAETDRRNFLRRIAPNAFLIMDEAHNAGGSGATEDSFKNSNKAPPRSELFREAVANAKSVMYSSATYAKSPNVMTLYSKTDMAKAVSDPKDLPDLISAGGVPLQQAVASMLARAGQYVRRERSFEGVSYAHENIPVSEESYGEFTKGLRAVFEFDRAFEDERKELGLKMAMERGGGTGHDTGVGEGASSSTSFSSIMHNVINQMIMALKAEKAGDRAVAALRAGEKPVIALSKTNASFISDFTKEMDLKVGDIADISFADILKKYLERTRRVTLKTGSGDVIDRVMIPLADLSAEARANYEAAQKALREMTVGQLPVSPIDAIRHAIEKAGYSVREVTGRDEMLDYSGNAPLIAKRPASEMGVTGKKTSVRDFNAGKLDAVILNKSGSTGISLHSSSKFADQRRRRMIIAEADPNIDTHMQMLGRVHRTGQIQPPAYTHLSADIPAEVRPTAVLMRKMASLNANTTGAAKSRFTSEAVDFLNKYGDQTVAQVMNEDPETFHKLGSPKIFDDEGGVLPGAVAKVTGRLTLLEPKEQQELLDKITSAYKARIEALDAAGANDLEAKSLDLQARVLESKPIKEATGPSPFEGAVNLDKVSIKSQGRAYEPREVVGHIAEALQMHGAPEGEFAEVMPKLEAAGRERQAKLIETTRQAAAEHTKLQLSALKDDDAKEKLKERANGSYLHFKGLAEIAHPGATVKLTLGDEGMLAIVTGFSQDKNVKKNPLAQSSWNVDLAVPSGFRALRIPLSRLVVGEGGGDIAGITRDTTPHADLERAFEEARKEGRENRYIVSGNLLAGFDAVKGRGQIINHTMEDGSVRPGILMNRSFTPEKFNAERTVKFANGEHLAKYLESAPRGTVIQSRDGVISINKKTGYFYDIEMPSAKGTGGRYYTDKTVRDVYDNWQRNGNKMRANVDRATATRIIDAMQKVGAKFETAKDQDAATAAGKNLSQDANASIRLRDGQRSIIRLKESANASSFLHEEAHDWLKELLEDSAHPEAPAQIQADAKTARDYLGVKGAAPTTAQHERWARTFEQYLREGVAPSARLANVFSRLKDRLLSIYKSLRDLWGKKKFEETVAPDIRAVFDRLLSAEGRGTIVASSLERGKSLADLHEQDDAEITNPMEVGAAAMRIDAEAAQHDANIPPEIAHEIESASAEVDAEQEQAGGEGSGPGAGEGADAARGPGDGAGERGAVGEDRGQPEPQPERGRVGVQPSEELSGKREPVGESGGGSGSEQRSGDREATRPGQPPIPRPSSTLDRDTPLVDKAGNIRIENLTTREDVAQAIRDAAAANEGFIGERRGVVTDAQVMDLADALGMDFEEINKRRIGQAFNAEQVVAARKLLIQSATDVAAKMRAAAIGTDEDVMGYAMAKDRHQMIQAQVAGITAEAGRALRAFRNITGSMGEAQAIAADQFIKQATGKTLYQLREEAKLGSALDTPERVSKMTADAMKRNFGDKVLEYWINGLISGPATHVTYSIGNAILAAVKAGPETAVAALIGGARRAGGRTGEFVRPGEVGAKFRGALQGLPGAFQAAAESFSHGVTARLPGEKGFEAPFQPESGLARAPDLNQGATYADAAGAAFANIRGLRDGLVAGAALLRAGGIKGEPIFGSRYSPLGTIQDFTYRGVNVAPVGTLARLPSRFIAAIHGFFRATNFSMEKSALAYRMASEERLVGAAFDQRVGELWQNPTLEIMKAATHEATEATLMGRGGEFTQALAKLTNARVFGFKLGKFIDPFVRISSNIIEQTLVTRTPLGILAPEIRADLMGRNGNIAQDTAQARMLVGTALSVAFGGLAASGFASGSGPSDPRKAAMWRLAGNQAHSVRIGDMWYDVHRLGPMGMLMSVAADMYDVAHAASSGDMLLAGATLQHAITQNVLDESFMRGPADLIKAMEDPGRYGEAYLRNWASSFVPYSVGMAQLARAMDPYSRQARTVMDAIKNKVPGESETLFPRRDVWGEPMANPDALIAAGVTSIYERRMSTDPVNLSLLSLGIAPSFLERKIRNVQLDDNQYDDFQRLAGRMTKQRLDIIVNSADFQSWPSHVQHDVITETIRQSREAARGVLMMKYPQIIREAMDAKRARLTGTGQ